MTDPTPRQENRSDFRGHPASLAPDVLLKQCTTRRYKASGPGGQHRNKVETAVELTHTPTGITAAATERRSQNDNQRAALKRLRLKLAIDHRCDTDPSQPPSNLWQSRVKDRRIVLSADHTDFPTLLAEALDTLAALTHNMPKTATVLGATSSQLIKLFQKEPAALVKVNHVRTAMGMHTLK